MTPFLWPPFRWNPVTGFNVLSRTSVENCCRYGSARLANVIQQYAYSVGEARVAYADAGRALERVKREIERESDAVT